MKKLLLLLSLSILTTVGYSQTIGQEVLNFNNGCGNPASDSGGVVIKTKYKFSNTGYMPTVIIEGYNYGGNQSVGLIINWYVYNVGQGDYFYQKSISSYGAYAPEVYLYNDGGFVSIFLKRGVSQYCLSFKVRSWLRATNESSSDATWYSGWTANTVNTPPTPTNNYGKVRYENTIGDATVIGERSIRLNSGAGVIKIKGDTGGWAMNYGFNGSGGADLGGFWAYGAANTVDQWSIGKAYTDNFFVVKSKGNVGIGTATPNDTSSLHIKGSHTTTATLLQYPLDAASQLSGSIFLRTWVSEPNISWNGTGIGVNVNNWGLVRMNNTLSSSYIRFIPQTSTGMMLFSTIDAVGVKYDNTMAIVNDKVGIGTIAPTQKLSVAGNIFASSNFISGTGADGYYGWGSTGPSNTLSTTDSDYNRAGINGIYRFNHHTGISMSAHSFYGGIRFYNQGYDPANPNPYSAAGNNMVMAITNNSVGIGTTTPTNKLEIKADLGASGLTFTGLVSTSATAARPLAVDNTGKVVLGTGGGSDNNWTKTGSNLSNSNSGNIGIGTANPISPLSVQSQASAGNKVVLNINNPASYGVGLGVSSAVLRFNRTPNDAGTTGVMADIFGGNESETTSSFGYLGFATRNGPTENTIERMRLTSTGNVGIGTTTPNSRLEVNGNTRINGDLNIFNTTYKIVGFDDPANYYIGYYPVTGSAGLDLHWYGGIRLSDRTGNVMQITNGNIGIGTTDTKGYKLAVGGDIIAERVVVKLQTAWPDFVFKKSFSLRPLSEVEIFINQNSHLPEVPSAADVADKGIDVGAMNAKLLQKVEELTLYLIEMKKENEKQTQEIEKLKLRINK